MRIIGFDPSNERYFNLAAALWNDACGPDLAISRGFVRANLEPTTGIVREGRFAFQEDQAVGFVLVSAPSDTPTQTAGWVEALAVASQSQRQGVGSELLNWAEDWLWEKGCRRARLGGGLRPFTPGLPTSLGNEPFFTHRGYRIASSDYPYDWDVARCLEDYPAASAVNIHEAGLWPVEPGQEGELLAFLEREFPGRWSFEAQEYLRQGGQASDYLLLWFGDQVQGFCQTTQEGSLRPIERFYMHRLPKPWGQIGPLGVGREARGKGLGLFLVDSAARYLKSLGVNGCLIDWTSLLDFYAKLGFKPYRQYTMLVKDRI